eukprot:5669584-Pleurochrysis_carterae.AAC.1
MQQPVRSFCLNAALLLAAFTTDAVPASKARVRRKVQRRTAKGCRSAARPKGSAPHGRRVQRRTAEGCNGRLVSSSRLAEQ